MNDTEFIDFMKELILAPDSAIKKAHMERAVGIIAEKDTRIKELEFYLNQLPAHNWHQKWEKLQAEANKNMEELCRARADALVMALRLFGEDDSTFGPECHEVMKKWGQIAVKEIAG